MVLVPEIYPLVTTTFPLGDVYGNVFPVDSRITAPPDMEDESNLYPVPTGTVKFNGSVTIVGVAVDPGP